MGKEDSVLFKLLWSGVVSCDVSVGLFVLIFFKEESSFDFFHLPASSLSTNQCKAPVCFVTLYISLYL
jgi:hypothetical protein